MLNKICTFCILFYSNFAFGANPFPGPQCNEAHYFFLDTTTTAKALNKSESARISACVDGYLQHLYRTRKFFCEENKTPQNVRDFFLGLAGEYHAPQWAALLQQVRVYCIVDEFL